VKYRLGLVECLACGAPVRRPHFSPGRQRQVRGTCPEAARPLRDGARRGEVCPGGCVRSRELRHIGAVAAYVRTSQRHYDRLLTLCSLSDLSAVSTCAALCVALHAWRETVLAGTSISSLELAHTRADSLRLARTR